MIKSWIEAMRLRTLPVSVAGVLAGTACAIYNGGFDTLPFIICMVFAILAQIVSNFANEYFDFRNGLDKKGREGFRRGVTEGDISPKAMLTATLGLLAVDCMIGLSLIWWGGWWLLAVGVAIALFALGYSTGPWPLSHHGLGEIAVIVFFGIIPVCLTAYVQQGDWHNFLSLLLPVGLAIGLMGANVLIVNNYRDMEDDKSVGKHTTAVIFGREVMGNVYFFNGILACLLLVWATIGRFNILWQAGTLVYLNFNYILWRKIKSSEGAELNPLLGKTAMLMFFIAVWLFTMTLCG
ncbi:MAG: 1,4-dihydroxy-2-naphthoate octaprenyltransferase [Muribaculaceae bacterium]|nr:1,4-dihydroxy-2-naphthoate octaprenyltransferase [Muribaculaceae bacterium]